MKNLLLKCVSLSLIFVLCMGVFSYQSMDVLADEISDVIEQTTELTDEITETTEEVTETTDEVTETTDEVAQTTDEVTETTEDVTEAVENSTETTEEVEVADPNDRYVAVTSVKIRKKASSSSKSLGKITWKTKVTYIKKSGKWSKISYNGIVGYVKTSNLTKTYPTVNYKSSYTRYVKKKTTIRKTPCTASTSGGTYKKGKKVTCYGTSGSWTVIKKSGKEYFIQTKYLSSSKPQSSTGSQVVSYAKKFIGNKYKYGGTSLTKGTDCSGFTQSVFKHFGYKLPRTSSQQRKAGKAVKLSNRKVGDLICYSGHVAIYIGNNKIIHASNSKPYPKGGIKISSMNYRKILAVRRIVK